MTAISFVQFSVADVYLSGVRDFVLEDEVDAVAQHLESARVVYEEMRAVRLRADVRTDRYNPALSRTNLRQPTASEENVSQHKCRDDDKKKGAPFTLVPFTLFFSFF